MTTNSPNPVDGDVQELIDRIGVALKQFTSGRASMHVPPLDTDVDIVLADCEKMLKSLTPPAQLLRPVELPGGFSPAIGDIFDRQAPVMRRDREEGCWIHKAVVAELLRSLGHEVKS